MRIAGIVSVAVAVRLFFFTGFHGFDDVFYIRRAYALSQGTFSLPKTHWEARIGLVGPTAFAYRVFGVTLGSTVLFPFVCSILTVIAAFLLGRRLFGEPVGLLAALLVAIFPFDAIFASMLFPTAPVALLCGVGYGLFLLGDAEDRSACHLAAGAAFGLACLAHEAAAIALAFYPLYVVVRGGPRKNHLFTLLGFAAGLAVDPVAHGLMGNPWARLDVLAHAGTAQGTAADVAYRGFNATWIAEPLIRLLAERTFGLFSWLIAPLALYRVFRPVGPHDRALSLVLITVFIWTEYGTMSVHGYAPLARLPRYLCPLTLPAMWLLARNLREAVRSRPRAIVLSGLAVTSLICLLLDSGNQLRPYESMRSVVATARPEVVVVEKADEFPLRFAERMKPPYVLSVLSATLPAHGLVIAKGQQARQRVEETPGVSKVAEISDRQTPYQMMLSNRLALALLRAVRPRQRFGEYKDKASPGTWAIYRLP